MKVAMLFVLLGVYGNAFAQSPDRYGQCMQQLKTDARFSSIANHVALDGAGTPNRGLLADKARPDEQQKQAIAEWIDARAQCVNFARGPAPISLHMAFVSIVPELYNGNVTFGEFNKKWRELYKKESKPAIQK